MVALILQMPIFNCENPFRSFLNPLTVTEVFHVKKFILFMRAQSLNVFKYSFTMVFNSNG